MYKYKLLLYARTYAMAERLMARRLITIFHVNIVSSLYMHCHSLFVYEYLRVRPKLFTNRRRCHCSRGRRGV